MPKRLTVLVPDNLHATLKAACPPGYLRPMLSACMTAIAEGTKHDPHLPAKIVTGQVKVTFKGTHP